MHALLDRLAEYKRTSVVHNVIDRYYYVEKIAELQLLRDLLNQARVKENSILQRYEGVYQRWRKDARWLNRYMLTKSF